MTGDHNIRLHRIDPRLLRIGDHAAHVDEDGEVWAGRVELIDGNHIYSAGAWHQFSFGDLEGWRTWYLAERWEVDG